MNARSAGWVIGAAMLLIGTASAAATPVTAPAATPAATAAATPAATATATPTATPAATAAGRSAYKSSLDRAATDYRAARAHCRSRSGNAKTVCIAEAKGALKRANAEAEAAYRNTPRAHTDARLAAVAADYGVAKAKCAAQAGAARKACLDAAKAAESQGVKRAVRAQP